MSDFHIVFVLTILFFGPALCILAMLGLHLRNKIREIDATFDTIESELTFLNHSCSENYPNVVEITDYIRQRISMYYTGSYDSKYKMLKPKEFRKKLFKIQDYHPKRKPFRLELPSPPSPR